jgi:hypothetical protein
MSRLGLKQVLVVTCDRDRWQFLLQIRSIGKFLEPCNLCVIINEHDPQRWLCWFKENCEQRLDRHHVKIMTREDFNDIIPCQSLDDKVSGWISQQIYKLLFSLKVNDPYLVLDSKNWFIKDSKLVDFQQRTRVGISTNPGFVNFYDRCLEQFEMPKDTMYRPIITPYAIDPAIVRSMLDKFQGAKNFFDWFTSDKIASEFMAYDLFAQSLGLEQDSGYPMICCKIFWYSLPNRAELNLDEVVACSGTPGIKMLSIDRKLLLLRYQNQLERLLVLD